jgi:uncharacterized protein GlcG (DUF336 family)
MELEVPSTTLSWEAGHTAVAAAVAHAQRLGVRINAAVCDASGLLVAFLRMPLSFPQSIELAIDKARTAAGFGFPTSKWMAVCGEDEAMKLGFSSRAGLIVFGGGVPIHHGGRVIGGIGVSGASATQDEECARAALAALGLSEDV